MEDVLKQFGIQPTLLIAQIINFAILAFVLTKLLYKPIISAIDKRREKIEESLRQAKKVEEHHATMQKETEQKLAEARRQAEEIFQNAKKTADSKRVELLAGAQREAENIVAKAHVQIKRDREQMEAEVQSRIGELAIAVTEKLLRNRVSKKDLEEHLKETVTEVSRSLQ